MIIAHDPERREFIHEAPDTDVPLSYIINDLWPKLGFLPIDPENPGVALIAEFMLNELILKNSESLDRLNLKNLKDLFSGEGGESGEEMDDDMGMGDAMEDMTSSPEQNQVKENKKAAGAAKDIDDENRNSSKK